MPHDLSDKLVISVASSALFDLTESDKIFRQEGESAYRKYQTEHINDTLDRGVAFPFIRRLLNLNNRFHDQQPPIEVILLSRNDPDTGLRVFRSIQTYGLNITRAAFLTGKSPFEYIPAFNSALFLSANPDDVRKAIDSGYPAGTVLKTHVVDDEKDEELRIAFDFDGVIVDDQAETVYQVTHDILAFHQSEQKNVNIPHNPGPLKDLFTKIADFQKRERAREIEDKSYHRVLRTAIVTARNAPSHERVVTTLKNWGVFPDDTFFLGGIEKKRILDVLKPHMFFDDQMTHLKSAAGLIPSVHVPFGIVNQSS